jgi:hypothetical protein
MFRSQEYVRQKLGIVSILCTEREGGKVVLQKLKDVCRLA